MLERRFKIGDIVEVTHYTPVQYPPGMKDEIRTEDLLRGMVGKRYRVMGLDDHGHLELHPSRSHWIWINADDVKLVPKRKRAR